MKPLIVLIGSFVITCIVLKIATKRIDYQLAGRISMALMLVFTAVGHFVYMNGMAAMLPESFPSRVPMVIASGVLEVAFAIALLLPNYKRLVGIALIVFFVLMLPLNIRAALLNINYQTGTLDGPGPRYLWFRIPLQALFITWVYFSTLRE